MKTVLALLILGPLWVAPLSAANVNALYETEVTVENQSRDSRLDAMQRALRRILIKVSGSVMVPQTPEMEEPIAHASRFVQQYRYQKGENVEVDGVEKATMVLWLRFDQKAVENILKKNNFPVWGEARPLVLVWLAVEQGGTRLLVGEKDGGLARTILDRASAQRGIPIKLPLLDEVEKQQISEVDIWGQFEEKITATAKRYGAQAVLTGRLFPLSGEQWQIHWDLYWNGEHDHWQLHGSVVELLISGGINGAADRMAEQFALSYGAESGRVELIVNGIQSFSQFDATMNYLMALNGVQRVALTSMAGNQSHFSIDVEGGINALKQQIALGKRLRYIDMPISMDAVAAMARLNTLHYKLR